MSTPTSVSEALNLANQHFTIGSTKLPIDFEFNYGHARFAAKLSNIGEQLILALTGDIGHVPYSLENPTGRSMLFKLVEESKEYKNIDFQIVNGSIIRMRQLCVMTPPVNAETLLATTIELLFKDRHFFKFINMVRQ